MKANMLRTIGVSEDFCDDTLGVKRRMHQHLCQFLESVPLFFAAGSRKVMPKARADQQNRCLRR